MAIRVKGSKKTEAAAAAWAALLGKGDPTPLINLFEKTTKAGLAALPDDIKAIEAAVSSLFGKLTTSFSDTIEADLEKLGHLRPGDGKAEFSAAMGHAFEAGVTAHLTAIGAELFHPVKHLGIPTIAAMIAEFAGFRELVASYHGPLIENAIRIPSSADHAAKFRSKPPVGEMAAQWLARRVISEDAATNAIAWSGLMPEYEAAEKLAAHRPISPFMLAAGFLNQDVDQAAIRDAAGFMGLRDQDVELMVDAVVNRSLATIRNSYVQEAMTAYGQGVISDEELNGALDDAHWEGQPRALAIKRAALLRRINLARDAEATIVPEIKVGLLSHIEGVTQLEAAGIQTWKAEMQATKADASALITARKKELSAEAKAEADRKRNLMRAAVAEFQRGVLDEAGLTAALLAIPIDPFEAASIVAVQNAVRTGKLKYLYGKLLTPAEAATLRIQVEAIGDQYKRQLITAGEAQGTLAAHGVDQKDIDALLARWAATRGKPTQTGQFRPV